MVELFGAPDDGTTDRLVSARSAARAPPRQHQGPNRGARARRPPSRATAVRPRRRRLERRCLRARGRRVPLPAVGAPSPSGSATTRPTSSRETVTRSPFPPRCRIAGGTTPAGRADCYGSTRHRRSDRLGRPALRRTARVGSLYRPGRRARSGSWIETVDGERYLDYTSGIGVTNTGHAHPQGRRGHRRAGGARHPPPAEHRLPPAGARAPPPAARPLPERTPRDRLRPVPLELRRGGGRGGREARQVRHAAAERDRASGAASTVAPTARWP